MPTDAEVICEFMEPTRSDPRWWHSGRQQEEFGPEVIFTNSNKPLRGFTITDRAIPNVLDLDALWDVEQKLAHGVSISAYIEALLYVTMAPDRARYDWRLIHATAAQKTEALAKVIRAIK